MIKTKLSVVINTRNEANYLKNCLPHLGFADEIVVIDMESTDDSAKVASQYTDKVFKHKFISYVEPARNFGISKASGTWILILDPDEEVSPALAQRLLQIAKNDEADFVKIPRQNIIFGEWLTHSRWWPDYNIRFFKKGFVTWQNEIHSIPQTSGRPLTLEAEKDLALIHHHYSTINEYLTRMIRYSDQQAKELVDAGYTFSFSDTVNKTVGEFLSRFFAGEGYKDGFHGLVLSTLQAFSALVVYLKVWESAGYPKERSIMENKDWQQLFKERVKEIHYWIYTVKIHLSPKKTGKFFFRLKRKFNQ